MGFPRQEYWSGFTCSPPGDLPDPEIKPVSPVLAGGFFTTEPPGKPRKKVRKCYFLYSCEKMKFDLTKYTDIYLVGFKTVLKDTMLKLR